MEQTVTYDYSRCVSRGKRFAWIISLLLVFTVVCGSGAAYGDLLEFTYVPEYGSTDDLEGHVFGVGPQYYKVAVYIYAEEMGWWTKPYLPCSGVLIQVDSSWTADITTRLNDEYATSICAFLIPDILGCPSLAGEEDLPDELFRNCIDAACTTRVARTLSFSGYEWDVRRSFERESPDSNYFSASPENAWVDGIDRLHLAIRERDKNWYCSEVDLDHALGYGTYLFQVDSRVGELNENVVLGMFIYDSEAWEENYREMDIEFSHWGNSTYPNAQFVVQPWEVGGNIYRWVIPSSVKSSTHSFHWTADSIRFVSARGHQSSPPFDSILDEWTYTRIDGIPQPGDERVTLNLWLFQSLPPSDSEEAEVIITSFSHYPPTGVQEYQSRVASKRHLMQNRPNPFSERTVIGFQVDGREPVLLVVSDPTGRIIRTLVDEPRSAGSHYISWDGRDDGGRDVNSGVYFYRLGTGTVTSTRKMVLVR